MLTPRSAARPVNSARTPWRSGTGTRSSARWSGRVALDGSSRRATLARWSNSRRPGRSPPATLCRRLARSSSSRSSPVDDRVGVVGADVRPDRGLPGRDPGHVAEPAGGQAQQRAVGLGPVSGRVHEGRRDQVGHVGHHCDQPVVVGRRQGDDVGTELGDDARTAVRTQPGRFRRSGVRTHVAPTKRSGSAPVDARLLGAGHRVAADEAGVRAPHRPPAPSRR